MDSVVELNLLNERFFSNGKRAVLCEHEWPRQFVCCMECIKKWEAYETSTTDSDRGYARQGSE